MKKIVAAVAVLIAFIILSVPYTAFANSAQRNFEGVTSEGAIVTTENCPVEVTSEKLTFNVLSYPNPFGEDFDVYDANVVAEYSFYNPADYRVNMQLVFPFGELPSYARRTDDYTDAEKYRVLIDGKAAERTVRATYGPYGFDVVRDIAKIKDEPVLYKGFSGDTAVYKYTVKNHFEAVDDVDYYFADFALNGETLFADAYYFSVVNTADLRYLRVIGDTEFEIYSIGQPLDDGFFSATYLARKFEKGYYHNKPVSGSTTFTVSTLTWSQLLLTNYNENLGVTENDYRNAVVDCIAQAEGDGVIVHDLNEFDVSDKLLYWYQYDVSIAAKATSVNTVVAPLYPDISNDYTPAKYSYKYLLSPASSWAKFENLDITINTEYFLLNPAFREFEKTNGGYHAHFDTLPQGELTFELCSSENPEYDDSFGNLLVVLLTLFVILPLCILAVILIAAIVIPIVVVKRSKKNKRQTFKEDHTCTSEQKDEAAKDFFDKR